MDLFISEHIMKTHSGNLNKSNAKWGSQKQNQDLNLGETNLLARLQINTQETFDPIPQALLRKYVAYARKFIQPVLSKDAGQVLKSFYLELRSKYRTSDAIPITTRQL